MTAKKRYRIKPTDLVTEETSSGMCEERVDWWWEAYPSYKTRLDESCHALEEKTEKHLKCCWSMQDRRNRNKWEKENHTQFHKLLTPAKNEE